jgi:hypothetical protein
VRPATRLAIARDCTPVCEHITRRLVPRPKARVERTLLSAAFDLDSDFDLTVEAPTRSHSTPAPEGRPKIAQDEVLGQPQVKRKPSPGGTTETAQRRQMAQLLISLASTDTRGTEPVWSGHSCPLPLILTRR